MLRRGELATANCSDATCGGSNPQLLNGADYLYPLRRSFALPPHMQLAFSTCWNSDRHTRGDAMLDEIFALGFERVELGHGIRQSLWEGVEQFLADHPMAVTSLHNFCPLPIEIRGSAPDCYQCTSASKAERDRARHYTLQTIDYANRVGARRVVMHLGSVMDRDYTDQLVRSII